MRAWGKTLWLALVLSAGAHLVALLAFDVPLSGGVPGVPQGFHFLLRDETGAAPSGPTPAAGPSRDDRYYRGSEVDAPAIALSRAPLLIPEYAYHSRLAGRVRARVFIGTDGGVEKIAILEVEPVRGLFERPALEALRGTRYQPARIGARAVRSQKVVDVVFDPRADDPPAGR